MREKAISNGYHLQLMNGVLFVILFASAAYQLSQWHYISLLGISPLIVGIVLGMVYGNTLRLHLPVYWLPGILFSSKVLLRVAIVLYGFRLTFQDLALVGVNGLAISAFMLTSTFIGGSWLGMKVFGLPRRLALLTAAGSSVCGAAAVLATEPVVRGESHESSIAVGTVVVFGTIAMFVYPFLFTHGYFDMSEQAYGMFVGGTLHEVAHAVAAGQAVSADAGNTAVIVKMIRVIIDRSPAHLPRLLAEPLPRRPARRGQPRSFLRHLQLQHLPVVRHPVHRLHRHQLPRHHPASGREHHQFARHLHADHGHVRPRHGNQP